jgi:hypothetical protein
MVAQRTGERRAEGHSFRPLPFVAALCCLTYALAHAWWTLAGTPEFVRVESVFVGGWLVVGVAAVAAVVCVGVGAGLIARWPTELRWVWCGVGWVCSAALAAYCLILWPSLAQLLLVPFGVAVDQNDLGATALRTFGTSAAVLTAVSTRGVVRELRSGCPACGRAHGRSPETRETGTSRWGYMGGYLAIIGLIIRMVPAVIDWFAEGGSMEDEPGGRGFLLFLGLMILAGTLLPLALIHRWGRIWPAWVPLWAGRPVPRWIVLGPGMMMSLGLLAYFGAGGVTATILGNTSGHPLEALEIAAYVLWGIGLAIACISYAQLTRPPCPDRQATAEALPARSR